MLPVAAIPYGFFGVKSLNGKALEITPNLPSELKYWGVENLSFNKVKYDLTIFENSVMINSVRGNCEGLSVQVVLNAPKNGEKLYVNGVATSDYKVEGGKAIVTLPFEAVTVQVLE